MEIESVSLIQLREVLPSLSLDGLSVEDQVRRVLYLLLDACESTEPRVVPHDDFGRCPNCDTPVESVSTPYCSEDCRGHAAFIRQFRSALATGSILTADKQIMFGERLWWLLGGGLPLRESRIPESAKRQVNKRSGGMCEFCGDPMTAVENFGSGCNRPLHLRAVCAACSKTKPFGDLEFSRSSPVVAALEGYKNRISAAAPLRPCDDPVGWDWRAYVAMRRR